MVALERVLVSLDQHRKVNFLLGSQELGTAGLPHPHLELFAVVVFGLFGGLFRVFVARLDFEEILFGRFARKVLDRGAGSRVYKRVTARRPHRNRPTSSGLRGQAIFSRHL